jgi:hypothetical protein
MPNPSLSLFFSSLVSRPIDYLRMDIYGIDLALLLHLTVIFNAWDGPRIYRSIKTVKFHFKFENPFP